MFQVYIKNVPRNDHRLKIICKSLVIVDLSFLLLELLVIASGLLVLLVLRHQIVHVGFSLSELHLIHTLASVPMEESLERLR